MFGILGKDWQMAHLRARGRARDVQRLSSFLARSGDWFVVVDHDLVVVWSAGNAEAVTGRSNEDVVGRQLNALVEVEGLELLDVVRRASEGSERRRGFRTRALHQDGARTASFTVVDGRDRPEIDGYLLIGRDDTVVAAARRRLDELGHVDELTGVGSRIEAERELAVRLARAGRGATPPLLLLADVVDFRGINKVHGSVVADLLLRELAVVISRWAHQEAHVSRVGADQFLVLLDPPAMGQDEDLAGSLRRAVDRAHRLGREVVRPHVRVAHLRAGTEQRDPGALLVAIDALVDRDAVKASMLIDLQHDRSTPPN